MTKKITVEHDEKETLTVDVIVPEHDERVTTPLFEHTRKKLIDQEDGRCFVCGRTAEESGHPLEAHHNGIERSYAEGDIDWDIVKNDFPNFDWTSFDPSNPYTFVDDMLAQGKLLCKEHHTGKDTGIHYLPYPLFIMQRYLKIGCKFNLSETIEHEGQV
jgi:hypothetical protein